MPTSTYTPIASVTLSASASEVVFSGLPQTYRDLIVVCSTFQNHSGDTSSRFHYNGDTGNNYSFVYMDTYGGSPSSGASANNLWEYHQTVSSTTPVTTIVQIMDYSATNKHKTALHRFGVASPTVGAYATRWANTNAITSLRIYADLGGNYLSNSTFTIFGVIA